jgi:hypothetical protein
MKIVVAFVHFVFATAWLGSGFYYVVVLTPRVTVLDAAPQRALARSLRSVMRPLLGVSAVGTIVTGLWMMVQLHPDHPGPFSGNRWGLALIIGTIASVLAGALALAVDVVARRAQRSPRGEGAVMLDWVDPRIRWARLAAVALLVFTLGTMAVARYS